MDSLLQVTICKHIHLTMRYLSKSEDVNVNEVLTLKTLDLKPSHLQSIYLRDTNSSMGDDALKGKMMSKLSQISKYITQTLDRESLQQIDKHLTTCVSLIKIFNPTTTEPANKKLKQQRKFYSTKRKRRNNLRLSKPSENESNVAKQSYLISVLQNKQYLLPL